MKRLLTGALALTLLTGAAAMAQPGHGYDRGGNDQRGNDQRGYDQHGSDRHDGGRRGNDRSGYVHERNDERRAEHRWARGDRLPPTYYRSRTYYVDYRHHHLRRPPYGYQWVQVDNNYALVALGTGLIASIIIANDH